MLAPAVAQGAAHGKGGVPPVGCSFFQLPNDTLRLIAMRLPLAAVSSLRRTCHFACHALGEQFWTLRLARDFPLSTGFGPAHQAYATIVRHCLVNPYPLPIEDEDDEDFEIDSDPKLGYGFTGTAVGLGGPLRISSGFVDGVMVNDTPLGFIYPDCGGSINRCFTGFNNRKEIAPMIAALTNKLNAGTIDFAHLSGELEILLRALQQGNYKIGRKLVKTGGKYDPIITFEDDDLSKEQDGYWGGYRIVQETQPASTFDQERVAYYVERINEALSAQPDAPTLKSPLPLMLVASTETTDFILDGHHKFRAYRQLNLRAPAIWVKPADPTPKAQMVTILGKNISGLRLLTQYGPKD